MMINRLAAPDAPTRTETAGVERRPRIGELVRASGGGRYAVAVTVDSLGSGMLRPFMILYAVRVLGLSVADAGVAMSLGASLGLLTWGEGALWGTLAVATGLAALAVARRTGPAGVRS